MNSTDVLVDTNDLKREALSSLLTTGDVARYCQVTVPAVLKWIKNGLLKTHTTPGGHHRVSVKNFLDFLERTEMPIPPELQAQLKSTQSKTRVLVVDDDPSVRELVADLFSEEEENFEVLGASDGFGAGRLLVRFRPHIVILDLVMPGINGFQVCSNIKNDPETSHIKVLIVTGYPTEENIARAKEFGADAILPKPFDLQVFRKEIARLLGN